MRVLFDTNVLVDYLNGEGKARDEMALHDHKAISVITWAEVLVGARNPEEEQAIRAFLATFEVEDVDLDVAAEAVRIRRERRLRLPDALIWATARRRDALFVTRNTKDFPEEDPGVRVPYAV